MKLGRDETGDEARLQGEEKEMTARSARSSGPITWMRDRERDARRGQGRTVKERQRGGLVSKASESGVEEAKAKAKD